MPRKWDSPEPTFRTSVFGLYYGYYLGRFKGWVAGTYPLKRPKQSPVICPMRGVVRKAFRTMQPSSLHLKFEVPGAANMQNTETEFQTLSFCMRPYLSLIWSHAKGYGLATCNSTESHVARQNFCMHRNLLFVRISGHEDVAFCMRHLHDLRNNFPTESCSKYGLCTELVSSEQRP